MGEVTSLLDPTSHPTLVDAVRAIEAAGGDGALRLEGVVALAEHHDVVVGHYTDEEVALLTPGRDLPPAWFPVLARLGDDAADAAVEATVRLQWAFGVVDDLDHDDTATLSADRGLVADALHAGTRACTWVLRESADVVDRGGAVVLDGGGVLVDLPPGPGLHLLVVRSRAQAREGLATTLAWPSGHPDRTLELRCGAMPHAPDGTWTLAVVGTADGLVVDRDGTRAGATADGLADLARDLLDSTG